MGVEYSLNDPAKSECFDFGKGWHGAEGSTDYDPAPAANPEPPPGCYRIGTVGYRWTPLTSRDETLHYVTTHFYFLEREDHSDGCMHANDPSFGRPFRCEVGCSFQEPDMAYAHAFADKLWAWLEGRDQSQLDVTDDCGDDLTCDGGDDHDEHCEKHVAGGYGRHFFLTGSRYLETERK